MYFYVNFKQEIARHGVNHSPIPVPPFSSLCKQDLMLKKKLIEHYNIMLSNFTNWNLKIKQL